ncbi:MAG: hypothetical protein PHG81_09630, partial [Aliarcobacter sp.]|nr:hypothetical protein [Aliarcobacter sp.]
RYNYFKDHPASIATLSIILSFDALQSNWTGIIIGFYLFVKGLGLKFGLMFRILRFLRFLLTFYWVSLYLSLNLHI